MPATTYLLIARGICRLRKEAEVTVAGYDVGDSEAIKKYGNVIDDEGIITQFEEKPQKPRGTLAAIALYYYSSSVLSLLTTYLAAGNNPDQPGRFVQWLYTRKPVKTFQIKGKWLDIGSKETLENADQVLRNYKACVKAGRWSKTNTNLLTLTFATL